MRHHEYGASAVLLPDQAVETAIVTEVAPHRASGQLCWHRKRSTRCHRHRAARTKLGRARGGQQSWRCSSPADAQRRRRPVETLHPRLLIVAPCLTIRTGFAAAATTRQQLRTRDLIPNDLVEDIMSANRHHQLPPSNSAIARSLRGRTRLLRAGPALLPARTRDKCSSA